MKKKKQIAILGSTGSIGTQALQVIQEHADLYEVYCLTANNRIELLAQQAHQFKPAAIVVANEQHYEALKDLMADLPDVKVYAGAKAIDEIVEAQPIDIVLTAMVGFAGLSPTIHAIKAHKAIALANKETLVVAGELIRDLAAEYHAPILPVDSEHSAIFQSLVGEDDNPIEKILLTASGGPFRNFTMEQIAKVTKADALRHPTWDMGAKITIDSASMMNKGFEVIEAKWLFDVEPERIHVIVHPESVIHSMVEFVDGAVLAQLGCPDMREPIQLALSYPERLSLNNKKLDFGSLGTLTFFEPDLEKFPCLKLAFDAIGRGGNIPCALNAANEAAVAGYLQDRIGFYDIASVAADTLACTEFVADPTLDDIFATNEEAFVHARSLIW
jgi:1-deoxy-D-xylulose-5-phosphate reductoisomerase